MTAKVRTGLDVARRDGFSFLKGKRVGLICNPTATSSDDFAHLADLVGATPGVKLAALFGPEHGVRGQAQDMIHVGDDADARTGVRVHSLYGPSFESLRPTPQSLEGLDILVFDIQDVGSRYYTFVYTMALCMEAAAKAGLEFVVLDRPNPIGLTAVEGNVVEKRFESFVGMLPLATRHGMTAGEIARWHDREHGVGLGERLHIVKCEGLTRAMEWEETGLPWSPPSPNMPTPDTARVYPGMCLIEGTLASEGRGTTRPFELWGAPYLEPYALAEALTAERLPGVAFRPVHFLPTFQKHARVDCGGVMLHVTDKRTFLPVRTGAACILHARRLGGAAFQWRTEMYEFVTDRLAIDLLFGTDGVRKRMEAGADLAGCLEGFDQARGRFDDERARHLLYA